MAGEADKHEGRCNVSGNNPYGVSDDEEYIDIPSSLLDKVETRELTPNAYVLFTYMLLHEKRQGDIGSYTAKLAYEQIKMPKSTYYRSLNRLIKAGVLVEVGE